MIQQEISKLFPGQNLKVDQDFDANWKYFKSILVGHDLSAKELAIDALNKLTAHSLIVASSKIQVDIDQVNFVLESDPINHVYYSLSLIDEIIYTVTEVCASIELSAMKFLLQIFSCPNIEIHGSSIIRVINFFFQIHIFSKNVTNSNTAKAALTRIVNLVLIKCQNVTRYKGLDILDLKDVSSLKDRRGSLDLVQEVEGIDTLDKSDNFEKSEENEDLQSPYNATPEFMDALCKNDVYLLIRFLCMMGLSIDGKIAKSEIFSSVLDSNASNSELSIVAIKARSLALELLLSIISNFGFMLSTSNHQAMIPISRQYLCITVTKNAALTNPQLFELSISNFLLILRFFLPVLLIEVEVLLNSVFIHILEMANSSNHQKDLVLQGLQKIAESPQLLVDLFVNYDCNVGRVSLFDRIVSSCVKITQGKIVTLPASSSGLISMAASVTGMDNRAENLKIGQKLKYRALCILVSIVHSLLEWAKDYPSKFGKHRNPLIDAKEFQKIPVSETPVTLVKNPLGIIRMTSNHADSPSPAVGNNDVRDFDDESYNVEELANKKTALNKAIRIFNGRPKKGFILLSQLGIFDKNSSSSVATFFRSSHDLSKSSIGEFLGEGDEFNIQVMYAFLDTFDFTNVPFVKAIRLLLQSFRLPGEAQKIDRIMEKFADRYVETNPEVFFKADTAYTLAFSIMMLNTDQHSPSIKTRMNAEDFIRMNRGINDENDLPEEYLAAIFKEVNEEEIILEEEHSGKVAQVTMSLRLNDLNNAEAIELYRKEVKLMEKKSHQLISSVDPSTKAVPFKTVKQPEIARLMFNMICWPLMATLGLLFESSQDVSLNTEDSFKWLESAGFEKSNIQNLTSNNEMERNVVDLCLYGFMGTIYLASIFNLDTERDALISSVANLTSLSNIAGMKNKNVCSIAIILWLSRTLGEYLDTSWFQILKIISQLEKLQIISHNSENSKALTFGDLPEKSILIIKSLVEELKKQSSIIAIDRIFSSTTDMSPPAIVQFFKCMCKISLEEVGISYQNKNSEVLVTIENPNIKPRMFLLQKLVETATYNLHRIRYEWTQIWKILQPHFNAVACHSSPAVAKFAVDSLRQLSVKFLEKEELGNFSTQVEFLKSFEWVMKNTMSKEVQDLILNSIIQMLTTSAKNIRSGWASIFVTIGQVAKRNQESELICLAFSVIQLIFDSYLDLIQNADSLVEYISCLSEFAQLDGEWDIVSRSMELLRNIAMMLMHKADNEKIARCLSPKTLRSDSPEFRTPSEFPARRRSRSLSVISVDKFGLIMEDHFHLKWLPLFIAFSKIAIHSKNVTVGSKAIDVVFELLNGCGHLFTNSYWKYLQRNVIFPIFEDLRESVGRESSNVVLISALRLWVETYTKFLAQILTESTDINLELFLGIMVDMMGLKDENLAAVGQVCFSQWVHNNFRNIGIPGVRKVIVDHIQKAFNITNPIELVSCKFDEYPGIPDTKSSNELVPDNKSASDQRISNKGIEISLKNIKSPIPLKDLDFDHTKIKCMNHLELIQSIGKLFVREPFEDSFLSLIDSKLKEELIQCFQDSYVIARYFNCQYGLRYAIWKSGLAQHIPNLVKQESSSLLYYMKSLFFILRTQGDTCLILDGKESKISEILVYEINDACQRFIDNLVDQVKNQRDISTLSSVIIYIFEELSQILMPCNENGKNKDLIKNQTRMFFKLGIKIMAVDRLDVRLVLQNFLEKVGDAFIKV